MAKRNQSTPGEKTLYFDVQADFGITKHLGGLKSTQELLALCHIQEGQLVLEVGCGIGNTACYMAKNYGCRVIGIDISERMVARSQDRAKRKRLETNVAFRVADAQHLPFEDGLFDAVISESAIAFKVLILFVSFMDSRHLLCLYACLMMAYLYTTFGLSVIFRAKLKQAAPVRNSV